MSVGAQPPNNLAAEAAVLGAILFDNRAYERVRDMLRPGDFYSSAHDAVFIACAALIEVGQVADGVTLREKFQTDDALNKVGGPAYLTELLESAAFGVEIIDYARIVRDLAVRRRLQSAGEIIASRAVTPDDGQSATDLVGQAVEDLKSVRDDTVTEDEWESSGKATSGVLSDLNERLFGEGATGEPLGLRTGLDALDKRLGGLHDGDLIIVAGRPSMGKTSLAMNMVKGVLET
ncbi:MAG: DnaB-like helicase N-terminal domain-containing protein, partial [Pseudomonadota bacterium]